MEDFSIYTVPGSPFARAVFVVLEEKGISYQVVPLVPGTLKSPDHLARHPFGRMPVLDHGDVRVYETQAIVRYIDRVIPEPSLTPGELGGVTRMDQLMNINDWYLFQGVNNVIGFQRIVGPRVLGLTPDEDAIAAAMPGALSVFSVLGGMLADDDFFTGSKVSLADAMLAPQVDFLRETPEWETLTAQHGNIRRWIDRMNARDSMRNTTWERIADAAIAA